jgi:glycosyltransferase involved in cell wall biosynthesis
MRILQVIPHLSKGGAEKVVVELSNSLVELDHEVVVLVAQRVPKELNENFLDQRIRVQCVSDTTTSKLRQYILLPLWIMKNRSELSRYDVVHCHLTFGLFFGIMLYCLRIINFDLDFKLIGTNHAVGTGTSGLSKRLLKNCSGFFDHFVLVAQDPEWRKFTSGGDRRNIQVISNGISSDALPNKLQKRASKDPIKIGTISRLEKERKPWLFLDTFAQLNLIMKGKVHFFLGGEGSEWDKLQEYSRKLGITPSLSMPGLVLSPTDFLKGLDLYITLNVEETTGISGLEAVFQGIPVIGIQLTPDYQPKTSDWIWSSQDPANVAIKISELFESSDILQDMAKSQFNVAISMYSVRNMRDKYLKIYAK